MGESLLQTLQVGYKILQFLAWEPGHVTARHVRQVGRDTTVRVGAFDLVAESARLRKMHPPKIVILFGLRYDEDVHVGVLCATILGALAAVFARGAGCEPDTVILAGDQVDSSKTIKPVKR